MQIRDFAPSPHILMVYSQVCCYSCSPMVNWPGAFGALPEDGTSALFRMFSAKLRKAFATASLLQCPGRSLRSLQHTSTLRRPRKKWDMAWNVWISKRLRDDHVWWCLTMFDDVWWFLVLMFDDFSWFVISFVRWFSPSSMSGWFPLRERTRLQDEDRRVIIFF